VEGILNMDEHVKTNDFASTNQVDTAECP
jgi:hypothetical protein